MSGLARIGGVQPGQIYRHKSFAYHGKFEVVHIDRYKTILRPLDSKNKSEISVPMTSVRKHWMVQDNRQPELFVNKKQNPTGLWVIGETRLDTVLLHHAIHEAIEFEVEKGVLKEEWESRERYKFSIGSPVGDLEVTIAGEGPESNQTFNESGDAIPDF